MSLTMYDSVTISQIPHDAKAVAGYVNGRYRTFPQIERDFPHAHKLSIAVTAEADAECLDVEAGDARPDQAPLWVARQLKRGVRRPVVYASVSQMPAVLRALATAGIKREAVRVWTAHYTGTPHRCTARCGFGFDGYADATQYTDRAFGRNLDASLCAADFFAKPKPTKAQRRKRLRAWVLAKHRAGWGWPRIKRSANWRAFRKLGGSSRPGRRSTRRTGS